MKNKHLKVWREMVVKMSLKGWEDRVDVASRHRRGDTEEFTLQGFYDRLLKWVAVDDQVHSVASSH